MPWNLSITLDPGREDVGTIAATYSENDTVIATFSDRAETSEAGIAKFMIKANAHLAATRKQDAKEAELSLAATAIANKVAK